MVLFVLIFAYCVLCIMLCFVSLQMCPERDYYEFKVLKLLILGFTST